MTLFHGSDLQRYEMFPLPLNVMHKSSFECGQTAPERRCYVVLASVRDGFVSS